MDYANKSNIELEQLLADKKDRLEVAQGRVDALTPEVKQLAFEIRKRKEAEIGKSTGVRLYGSDDYWGLSAGKFQFYFGYEETMCLEHKECECQDKEWCFIAKVRDVEVMRVPESRLGQSDGWENLLHGIGQFMATWRAD